MVTPRAVTLHDGSATLRRHAQAHAARRDRRRCRRARRLRQRMERSLSGRRPREELSLQLVHRAAEDPRSGALVHVRRMGLHPADLRAAAPVPLPQAAVRADPAGRARDAAGATARRCGDGASARFAGLGRRVHRVRDPDPARHPLPAAPRVRRRRGREAAVPRSGRGRDQAQVHARRLPADRHARAHGRRLRLPDQAARASAGELADLRPHERVRRRAEGALGRAQGRKSAPPEGPRNEVRQGRQGAALDRPAAVPAGGRRSRGPAHLPRADQGPVPAVRVLARDAVLRADAGGGRPVLFAARHERRPQPDARLVAGRDRALHAHREQPERPDGARAQSPFPRRAVSVGGRAGRPRGGTPRRRGPDRAVRRPHRLHAREGRHSLLEQVPAGLLRPVGDQLRQFRPGGAPRPRGRSEPHARDGGARHLAADFRRHQHVLPRVQLPRSGGRRALRARAEAPPGDLDRGRLGGVHLDLPERPRHPGHGADPAGDLRLSRGRGRA